MPQSVLFLDDGGVMSDNRVRGAQWQRLVGEFLAPRLGGTPEAWAAANRAYVDALFVPEAWSARLAAAPDYAAYDRAYHLDWMAGMCARLGLPTPPPDEAIALARATSAYVIPRVRAAFPGAADAIRALHAAGYVLHTASGESSSDLTMYLDGMGVRACFGRLYGPDLIDTLKNGPAFYMRMFADLGLAPGAAVVVDDSPAAAAWAAEAGARTVLVHSAPPPDLGPTLSIRSLAELPARLEEQLT